MERIRNIIVRLRGQLWLIPLVMSIFALALAWWLLTSGAALLAEWNDRKLWWLYGGEASSARDLLSSLLSGLMTMTSLVVSVTFVILTLAANQLGPRLISTFMGDRQIQTVLGLFLGTILYVLVVLRSFDEILGVEGVPHVAVTIGSVLTVVCLFALLFYVHEIARAIIADSIVARVAGDLHNDIRSMLPAEANETERAIPDLTRPRAGAVMLDRRGDIQVIDSDRLVTLACRADAVFAVKVRAGHFVLKNGEHVVVHAGRALGEEAMQAIRAAFVVGQERNSAQDLEFGLRQLVEIALRALSPGINDPFTAIAVIDRIGAALEEIFMRSLQQAVWRDKEGKVRVIAQRSDVQGLADAAFNAIRQAGQEIPVRPDPHGGRHGPARARSPRRGSSRGRVPTAWQAGRDDHGGAPHPQRPHGGSAPDRAGQGCHRAPSQGRKHPCSLTPGLDWDACSWSGHSPIWPWSPSCAFRESARSPS
ncbi:DUF2254 domain-containing protein [Microvirga sp. BT688]|uniref:DUF2254 domain-containing protein n=1 Tax=Microvirga sp. TaxID=1873136 RepID=UPI001683F0D0|nr:DUF2254 domain-containing protein [Microvirga sp.]MBD2750738.1 DUF2254 domain-containing protein [Microvirga sp.]